MRRVALQVPLDDEICSRSSIYLMKQDGSLWTIRITGDELGYEPYKQVRPAGKAISKDVLICVKCKHQWLTMPIGHTESA